MSPPTGSPAHLVVDAGVHARTSHAPRRTFLCFQAEAEPTLRAADGRLFVPARSGMEEFDPPAFAGHKGFIRPEFLARRLW
jgi:hypothetical protein